MNDSTLRDLYEVILARKREPQEGSYTCYLFSEGRNKILKKLGEECAETIIAAKDADAGGVAAESCDLLYHLLVLLAELDIPLDDVLAELRARSHKIGNLKPKTASDPRS